MDAAEFQAIAEEELAQLPAHFLEAIDNVVIMVDDLPNAATLAEMGIDTPYGLLGLYQGWPLPERGSSYGGHLPDMIHLFRVPILAMCRETGEDIRHSIRHVLVHEIGHYFGFSDAEMEAIEWRQT